MTSPASWAAPHADSAAPSPAPESATTPSAPTGLRPLSAPVRPGPWRPRILRREDPKFKPQRDRYLLYVRQMLGEMAGWPNSEEAGKRGRRPGDEDRRGALDPGREPQPRQDLQSHDPGRARGAGPGLPLGPLPRGRRSRPGRARHRRPEHRLPQDRRDLRGSRSRR